MINDRYSNYEDENIENKNFSEQYKDPFDERSFFEEKQLSDNDYLDNEYSNAMERDNEDDFDFEQNTPETDLDENLSEEDLEEDEEDLDENDLDDDLVERYDENDQEPETFSDDGYKID